MKAQDSRVILFSAASSSEESRLSLQLADIGYTHTIKLNDPGHVGKKALDYPSSILLLLLLEATDNQDAITNMLAGKKSIPVFGLFSRKDSLWEKRVVMACDEVATWPCSKQELNYRIQKLTANRLAYQELGHSLFVKMNILGNAPEFLQVLDKICKITKCDAPVFIEGETGTGKELIARSIHYLSERKDQPFIAANCGSFPDQLFENEFFGHERGAYTDARESSDGMIAQAEGGTLFLDEIETLSARGQVSLLRFLENMTYRPLGSKKTKLANLRIITATNENIPDLVDDGSFRKDLYYRINIMNLLLPALRDRASDIILLAEHFIRQFQIQYQQPEKELHPDTKTALKYHDWPGNVRELQNLLHREFLLADGNYITIKEIESKRQERRCNRSDRRLQRMFDQSLSRAKHTLITDFEQQYLSSALARADGNISEAARIAGKERRSFTRLLDKYDLGRVRYKTH